MTVPSPRRPEPVSRAIVTQAAIRAAVMATAKSMAKDRTDMT
jgi:hypothetical protein